MSCEKAELEMCPPDGSADCCLLTSPSSFTVPQDLVATNSAHGHCRSTNGECKHTSSGGLAQTMSWTEGVNIIVGSSRRLVRDTISKIKTFN